MSRPLSACGGPATGPHVSQRTELFERRVPRPLGISYEPRQFLNQGHDACPLLGDNGQAGPGVRSQILVLG